MNISTPENKRVHFHHWLTYCCAIILTERSPPSALCVYEFAHACSVTTVLVFPFSRSLQSVALFMYNLSNHVHTQHAIRPVLALRDSCHGEAL